MIKNRPFTTQLLIIGGFIAFFYIFFALTTQVYKDYKLEKHLSDFEAKINELAHLANQKPEDVQYFSSTQYKDRYAKESLNLLNPGERLIVIPGEEYQVSRKTSALTASQPPSAVLDLPKARQWWEYFFGNTLSLKTPSKIPSEQNAPSSPAEKLDGIEG